jgi:hypothetical protein
MDEHSSTVKKNAGGLLGVSGEVDLEVNTEESMYVFMSRHQNAEQIYNFTGDRISFENLAKFRYLGTVITNQILMYEDIK